MADKSRPFSKRLTKKTYPEVPKGRNGTGEKEQGEPALPELRAPRTAPGIPVSDLKTAESSKPPDRDKGIHLQPRVASTQ